MSLSMVMPWFGIFMSYFCGVRSGSCMGLDEGWPVLRLSGVRTAWPCSPFSGNEMKSGLWICLFDAETCMVWEKSVLLQRIRSVSCLLAARL